MDGPLFELSPYHVAMLAAGGALLFAYWLPTALFGRCPSSSALTMLFGLLGFQTVPGMPAPPDPRWRPACGR